MGAAFFLFSFFNNINYFILFYFIFRGGAIFTLWQQQQQKIGDFFLIKCSKFQKKKIEKKLGFFFCKFNNKIKSCKGGAFRYKEWIWEVSLHRKMKFGNSKRQQETNM